SQRATCSRSSTCPVPSPPRRSSAPASASMRRWPSSTQAQTQWASNWTRACRRAAVVSPAPTTLARVKESPLRIGPYVLPSHVVLAPMAGVTDRPFRILCRKYGAGLAASEMLTSDTRLWTTSKSQRRMNHEGEPEPRVVQLAGADPVAVAEAARLNVDQGAQ